MRRLLYCYLILVILLSTTSFPLNQAEAAAGEQSPQPVTYDSGDILFTMPDGNSFGSNKESLMPLEVTIPSTNDPIAKVELRDATTKQVLQEMESSGGGKYRASAPVAYTGKIALETEQYVGIPVGYFEWFRDPSNKLVWMYDYEEYKGQTKRFYIKTDRVYDSPAEFPEGNCSATSLLPTDPFPKDFPDKKPCNQARDYRMGNLNTSTIQVVGTNTSIPVTDAAHLQFSTTDFELDSSVGNLETNNILGISTDLLEPSTQNYRFTYTAKYNVPPDITPPPLPDGSLLVRWNNKWQIKLTGYVYQYPKLEAVAYTTAPTEKTELIVTSLTGPACIQANTPATFNYKITNSGPATSTSFKVKVSADGTEIITHTFPGIGTETKPGTFNYTFSAAGTKVISVYVDSDNSVDESNEGNNTKSVTFEAKASCSGDTDPPETGCSLGSMCDGEFTGTLRVDEPKIKWKEENLFEVTIKNPNNGCTAVNGRFKITQGSIEFAYGWKPISNDFDAVYFRWGSMGYSGYPGDIGEGNVKVYYYIEDSCGRYSLLGPEPFGIIKPPAAAPVVKVSWYNASGQEIEEAVQDDIVSVKASAQDSNGETVTLSWDFNASTDWLKGLPAKYGWKTPFNKTQYTGITADVKGKNNKVCVTVTNESGLSASACAYLDIIGPEPIAVITVGGWLKEDRRIELSGEKSSSPRNLALTYAWSIVPIPGQTEGTPSDISYIAPLEGKLKDFKTQKKGKYLVSLVVTDSAGLSASTSTEVDVAPDLPPISNIAGNQIGMRQASDRLLANFVLLGSGMSIDQDIISKRYWRFWYDANNDGIFDEPATVQIDEDALNLGEEYKYTVGGDTFIITRTGTHIVSLKGEHVGHYKARLDVVEIPGQPTDLIH